MSEEQINWLKDNLKIKISKISHSTLFGMNTLGSTYKIALELEGKEISFDIINIPGNMF